MDVREIPHAGPITERNPKWRDAPKFHTDHQGVWILGDATAPLGLAPVGGKPKTYTVVDPDDFYSADELPHVQSLVTEGRGGS